MDAELIQNRIYQGRGKAAVRIGLPCQVYRPETLANPFTRQLTIIHAAFNSGDANYSRANQVGDAIWYTDLDGRLTQEGDYLVRVKDGETWYIAAQQQLLPIMVIACARRVYISRVPASSAVGVTGYASVAGAIPVLGNADTPWPASVLIGGRIQANPSGLPAGVRESGWVVMLPPSAPTPILAGDLMTDDIGRRFAIESAELTDLGWRMVANEVHA